MSRGGGGENLAQEAPFIFFFFFFFFFVVAATAPQRRARVKNTLAGHTQHTPWQPKAPPLPTTLCTPVESRKV